MTVRRHSLTALLLLIALACATGCGGQRSGPALQEIRRLRSGNIDVVILAPSNALKATRNYCAVEFRSAANQQLVDVGSMTVHTSMTMEGAPMEGFVTEPKAVEPGRYTVEMVLAMSGNWTIAIAWMGPAGSGEVRFPAAVQ